MSSAEAELRFLLDHSHGGSRAESDAEDRDRAAGLLSAGTAVLRIGPARVVDASYVRNIHPDFRKAIPGHGEEVAEWGLEDPGPEEDRIVADILEESLPEDEDLLDPDGDRLSDVDAIPVERVELSAEEIAWRRKDAELRRRAVPLFDLTPDVIADADRHPFDTLTCEACGAQPPRLRWCGVALCIPCWRKQGARSGFEVTRVTHEWLKIRARDGVPPGLRLITLTVRSGPDLAERTRVLLESFARLRQRSLWREHVFGCVSRLEVTWNPAEGWHPHLHLLAGGGYVRSSPPGYFEQPLMVGRFRKCPVRPPAGEPRYRREYEPESDLRTEWTAATRGEGSVVDVRAAELSDGGRGLVRELTKYLAKPFASASDGSRLEIADWPEDVRAELARFVRGGERVRWYCPTHRTSNRRLCPDRCPDGEYRREAVGARRLRWYGVFRSLHAATDPPEESAERERRCDACGKGRLLTEREVAERLGLGWRLPGEAVWPLPSIRAHRSRARRWRAATFDGSSRWSWAGSGAEGPPPDPGIPPDWEAGNT